MGLRGLRAPWAIWERGGVGRGGVFLKGGMLCGGGCLFTEDSFLGVGGGSV